MLGVAASGVSVETIKRLERMDGPLSETRVATVTRSRAHWKRPGSNLPTAIVRLRKSSGGSIPVEELNAANDD